MTTKCTRPRQQAYCEVQEVERDFSVGAECAAVGDEGEETENGHERRAKNGERAHLYEI